MMKRKSDNWEFSWVGAQSLAEVQEALPNKMQLLHVQPNRINLFFGEKSQKSVPISLKSELTFKVVSFKRRSAINSKQLNYFWSKKRCRCD